MQEENEVLASAQFIASRSTEARVSPEGVLKAAQKLDEIRQKGSFFTLSSWKEHLLNPKQETPETIDWIFLVDTLNFSFWPSNPAEQFTVAFPEKGEHKKLYTGYWSLCAAINRALEDKIPVTNANYMSNITVEDVTHIFRSETSEEIPLLDKRVEVIKEAGRVLLEKFGGSFVNCILAAEGSAQKLLRIIVDNFSSYKDEAVFEGRTVRLYKRAQILVADIWACFEGKGYGQFNDIGTLTMFADYRVPQGLVYLGALEYSEGLLAKLNEGILLPSGDPLEVQIRGCSIWAVELMRREMERLQAERKQESTEPLNSIFIDYYIWDYSKAHTEEMKHIPIHKTRSVFY